MSSERLSAGGMSSIEMLIFPRIQTARTGAATKEIMAAVLESPIALLLYRIMLMIAPATTYPPS